MLVQLLSLTENQMEKTEKLRSEGLASDLIKARKDMWVLLYHLIRDKFKNTNSHQREDEEQIKVDDYFNIQYEKLKPVVLHSKLCRHKKGN